MGNGTRALIRSSQGRRNWPKNWRQAPKVQKEDQDKRGKTKTKNPRTKIPLGGRTIFAGF